MFATADVNQRGLLRVSSDGGTPQPFGAVAKEFSRYAWPTFLPDGKTVLFSALRPNSVQWDEAAIVAARLDTGESHPYLATPANETLAQFSPDGRWVAYQSNESGRPEVFGQGYPASAGKWQISTAGGVAPRWRADGRELFYRNDDALMAVPVTTGASFSAGRPAVVFRGPYETS